MEPEEQETPPPAPQADVTITLLESASVSGEIWLKGKVLPAPADEAAALIASGKAREATALDKKIAGID